MVRTMVSKTVNMGSNPVSDGFFSRIFYGFWMSKIIKSYYKLITNFQDDLKGSFLNKLKRRQRTLNLLAWKFLLNKVKPVRLDDLLLPRLKRRSINSFYAIQLRKLRFFYGFYRGYKSVFFKRFHKFLKSKTGFSRVEKGLSFLELRLDTVLVRIGLFSNINLARNYIKLYGLMLNSKHTYAHNYILKKGDVFSVLDSHKTIFKLKVVLKLNPSLGNIGFITSRVTGLLGSHSDFSSNFLNRFILSDINKISVYERLLSFQSLGFFDFNILKKNRSVLFLSYLPRFLEFNFRTFEVIFVSSLKSFDEIKYPFKLKTVETKRLIESAF